MHFIIGFACLAGIYHLTRGHARRGYRRGHFKGRMIRHRVDRALRRIDASPDQANEIHDAVESLTSELSAIRGFAKRSKDSLLAALSSEEFAENEMETIFSEQQSAVGDAQKAFKRALSRIHEVLDPAQREQLIQIFSRQHHHHPYR